MPINRYTFETDTLGDCRFKYNMPTLGKSVEMPLEDIFGDIEWTKDQLPSVFYGIYSDKLTKTEAVVLLMDHAIQQLELQMINASKLRQIIQQKKETAIAKVLGDG